MIRSALFGLVGAGGFAREVASMFSVRKFEFRYVVNANDAGNLSSPEDRIRVPPDCITQDDFLAYDGLRYFNIAIGSPATRRGIAELFFASGLPEPLQIRAPSAIDQGSNEIGSGLIACANSIITTDARIGKFFHLNLGSYVAHDCVIGDFVTFAPHVCCNGNVHIEDDVYVGTGAILRDGTRQNPLRIGRGAVIGMGAVVTRDVPAGVTVVGNPAKILEKKPF